MSEEKPVEQPKVAPPEKGMEKKINIIAIVAILAIIGIVFYVISKDAGKKNAEKAGTTGTYSMESKDPTGLVVPPEPPVVQPAPGQPQKPAAPKPPPADLWAFLPDPVAEMDGKPVAKQVIVDIFMAQFQGRIPPNINQDDLKSIGYELVNNYVNLEIVLKIIRDKGMSITPEEVKSMLNENVRKMEKEDPFRFNMLKSALGAEKLTLDAHIDQMSKEKGIQDNALIKKYYDQLQAGVKVTDAEAREFYEANKQAFFTTPADPPGTIRASHILFMVKDQKDKAAMDKAQEQAKKTLEEIRKNPADFGKIAAAVSDCDSKYEQGSLGVFGRGRMIKPFEDAAFALKEGEISEPVLTEFGYHIIRRDASIKEKVQTFEEAKAQAEEMLKAKKTQDVMAAEIEKARADRKVKIFVELPRRPEVPTIPVETPATPAPAPAEAPAAAPPAAK